MTSQELLASVPPSRATAVGTILNTLASLLGSVEPAVAWIADHRSQLLTLLDGGFSIPSILSFIANIFPAQPTPPAPIPPAPTPAPVKE